ncbi:MAG: GAF domain-containing protein [Chloroflexi bacterium]|nr:GAF domain-containing protein [Chloroflexota bacterium]
MQVSNAGLSFKVLLIIVSVSLIGALTSSALVLTLQRQQLIDNSLSATTRLSDGIQASLEYAMFLNDREMANQIIQRIVQKQGIERIRILDAGGAVTVSSLPGEIGKHFDYSNPACQFCHAGHTRPSNQTTIHAVPDQSEVLLNVNLIYNKPQCYQCHVPQEKILGILVVELPLADLSNQLTAAFWRISIAAFVTLGLMAGLMILALRKLIIQPVRDLDKGIAEIRAGNLDYALPAPNHDELGNLAESFDAMRQQLKSSHTEMKRREREATMLHRLMLNISASLELEHVLDAIARGAREMLDADIGVLALNDENPRQMTVKACLGCRTNILDGLAIPSVESSSDPFSAKPIYIECWSLDLPIPRVAELITHEGIVSSLAAPMWSNGRRYGYVGVMTRQRRHFTRDETELFMRLTQQVVVAIENAELYQRVRPLAILEERDRLAREMHDNLAQMLGYMNIKTAITDDQLAKNQIAPARSSLLELKQIVKEAYTDVREVIFNLRSTTSGFGLVHTLGEYLTEYRAHYGIDAQLVVEPGCHADFPPEIQVQVNRIIQEALTNVRKHSGANQTRVRFEQMDRQVRISIEDNGKGFDPAHLNQENHQHVGLQIMRERAESVGGELMIDSRDGSGTRVMLLVPIYPVVEAPHEDTAYLASR